jgi:hypothetical protein
MALTDVLYNDINGGTVDGIVKYFKECVADNRYHINSIGGKNVVGYSASIFTSNLDLAVEELIKNGYWVKYRMMTCAYGSFYGIVIL